MEVFISLYFLIYSSSMPTENSWDRALGPFYAESGLVRHGIQDTVGLIGIKTEEGSTVYPHGQFDVLPDQTLRRREKVLELWNSLIQPAIEKTIIDEYTAAALLLQGTEQQPSKAVIIANDETQADKIALQISNLLARFSQ